MHLLPYGAAINNGCSLQCLFISISRDPRDVYLWSAFRFRVWFAAVRMRMCAPLCRPAAASSGSSCELASAWQFLLILLNIKNPGQERFFGQEFCFFLFVLFYPWSHRAKHVSQNLSCLFLFLLFERTEAPYLNTQGCFSDMLALPDGGSGRLLSEQVKLLASVLDSVSVKAIEVHLARSVESRVWKPNFIAGKQSIWFYTDLYVERWTVL